MLTRLPEKYVWIEMNPGLTDSMALQAPETRGTCKVQTGITVWSEPVELGLTLTGTWSDTQPEREIQIMHAVLAQRWPVDAPFELTLNAPSLENSPTVATERISGLLSRGPWHLPLTLEGIAISCGVSLNAAQTALGEMVGRQLQLRDTQEYLPLPLTARPAPVALGKSVRLIRVMFGGPGDVPDELKAMQQAIDDFNREEAEERGIVLIAKHWSTHSRPEWNTRPQAAILRQVAQSSDLLIAAFYSRLGSSTGEAEAGTLEEIEHFARSGKSVMVYFSTRDVPQDVVQSPQLYEQYQSLQRFKTRVKDERLGLFESYGTAADLEPKLRTHLRAELIALANREFRTHPHDPVQRRMSVETSHSLHTLFETLREQQAIFLGQNSPNTFDPARAITTFKRVSAAITHHLSRIHDLAPEDVKPLEESSAEFTALSTRPANYGWKDWVWPHGIDLHAKTVEYVRWLKSR